MRSEILAVIIVLLLPWGVHRNNITQSPEVHVDQEDGIVETIQQQPAKIPMIYRILYPWAVPRDVIRGPPETPIEEGEENMERTEPPVEETVKSIDNEPLESIIWILLLTRTPLWFSLTVLTSFVILKHILRQDNLARILGHYLKFLQLNEFIYLLIDIWNRRGLAFEYLILPLAMNAGEWYQWVVAGLWSVWSKGWVTLENTVPPVLINIVTEHRLECFLGFITMLVVLLLIYFKHFYRLFPPTSSSITPQSDVFLPTTDDTIRPPCENQDCLRAKLRWKTKRRRQRLVRRRKKRIFLRKRAIIPLRDDTIPPSDVILPPNAVIIPPSTNAESAMEGTDSHIPRVAPSRVNILVRIRESCRPGKKHRLTKVFRDRNAFKDYLCAPLRLQMKRCKPPMVVRRKYFFPLKRMHRPTKVSNDGNIIPTNKDILPTRENAERTTKEMDVNIPRVEPTRNTTRPWSNEIFPSKSMIPAMGSGLRQRKSTFTVHHSIARRRRNVNRAMDKTDVQIPSVTPPRDHSNIIPQNGGIRSLPSSLMSPVTDDINMLLDFISQQRTSLAVDASVETRSDETRLHLRELFQLVKNRRPTKKHGQES